MNNNMRHFHLIIVLLISNLLLGQRDAIDRSNYELLWEISRDDMSESAYLFGTYHSNDKDIFDFPNAVYQALDEAEAVILETDISEIILNDDYNHYFNGYQKTNLLDWIIPARQVDKTTHTAYGSDDGRPQFIDMLFKQIADNCGKKFYALETIEDQLKIGFDNELDPNRPVKSVDLSQKQLKKLYREGNARALHQYTKDAALMYVDLYESLIVNRNLKMTDGIDTLIHNNNSSFIAVGAAHLLGKYGIVHLLREKGYTVKSPLIAFDKQDHLEKELLNKCRAYQYIDETFGASIVFGGKPTLVDRKKGELKYAKYIEFGQGNIYRLDMKYFNFNTDLDSVVRKYFDPEMYKIVHFDSVIIDEGVKALQGKLIHENNEQWLRVFHRNNIIYAITAVGGHRFAHSNRAISFFNTFKFSDTKKDVHLNQLVSSPSRTLNLMFPADVHENKIQEAYDDVWTALWFNPSTNEKLFAAESIMSNQSIVTKNEDFGRYLLSDYDSDEITFYDEVHKEGAYFQKSFRINKGSTSIFGKMRLMGNVIQIIKYEGSDEHKKDKFLSHFDKMPVFPVVQKQIAIENDVFSTKVTRSGFKQYDVSNEKEYLNKSEYRLNDHEHSLSYRIITKKYKKWAFSNRSIKEVLGAQIQWPAEDIQVEIDTTYDFTDTFPTLYFDIYYPLAENRFSGKVFIQGKNIILASVIYPNQAQKRVEHLSFLDDLKIKNKDTSNLDDINFGLLKNEVMINGQKSLIQLIEDYQINDSTLKIILAWPNSFWKQYDRDGNIRGTILVNLENSNQLTDVFEFWKVNMTPENHYLSLATLFTLQKQNKPKEFITVAHAIKKQKNQHVNFYAYLDINKEKTKFLASVWPVFSEILSDSLAWETSFILPDLMEEPFLKNYFTSDTYIKAVTSKRQPEWAAFRYLEILHKQNVSPAIMHRVLKSWKENNQSINKHVLGSRIAWETILGEKPSFKEKRLLRKNTAIAIAYAKVMAVSGTPIYEIYSYEDMIGYIAFDHYKDAYQDENKTLSHLENRTIQLEEKTFEFAFYEVTENKKTYLMSRLIPKDRNLPSYGGFGANTHFFYRNGKYNLEEIENELKMKIQEERDRE
ncbi:hypothetical protein CW751_05390 [Brumimicrobium salinarum]|uniref:TraB/GumN family protein n=1 Tax=Brumimicrobium salinarum TaxID=2058658 RepID=A0A2I0R4I2_9FLAO|nr:TraB/GumN family protein [Brumimicrobium salinarum]PKR81485.1 hypothetical protein CW751_05390 [Brumimicrobium salinarum]